MSSSSATRDLGEKSSDALFKIEEGLTHCSRFEFCRAQSQGRLQLSHVMPGNRARGYRDPAIVIVTTAPDSKSARGVPYAGPSGQRMMAMFREVRFGLTDRELPGDIPDDQILGMYRTYRTSAVKCRVTAGQAPCERVISECHANVLEPQLDCMPNLSIVVPMGVLATQSVTGMAGTHAADSVGHSYRLRPLWSNRSLRVIPLPHPSPANPGFSPDLDGDIDSAVLAQRQRFVRGLQLLRTALVELKLPRYG